MISADLYQWPSIQIATARLSAWLFITTIALAYVASEAVMCTHRSLTAIQTVFLVLKLSICTIWGLSVGNAYVQASEPSALILCTSTCSASSCGENPSDSLQ